MSLGDRLRERRHARFVGRVREIARFEEALRPGPLPFHVLYVHGPGGVGKSSLLEEFAYRGRKAGVPVCALDAHETPPAPAALLRLLAPCADALGLDPEKLAAGPAGGDLAAAGRAPARRVLLVDTYEAVAELDGWFRDIFLPALPEDTLVVLAGREPPATPWQADPGWQAITEVCALSNLSPDEAHALLATLGVPPEHHEPALSFTHGHPLALVLVAEAATRADGTPPFAPARAPDVVGTLLRRFVADVRDPVYRHALEACAVVRATTEPLLSALLGERRAHEAFAWLRGRAFVHEDAAGLAPHELVRDVLVADLRWRDADGFETLHGRARRHYVERLQGAATPETQQTVLADYAFLYRDHPVAGPLVAQLRAHWSHRPVRDGGPLQPGEAEALAAIVQAHEGDEAARLARFWLGRQPENVEVFRDGQGEPAGFLLALALERVAPEDRPADPAVTAALASLRQAALREGERATLFRFWMDRDHYQAVSPVQGLVFAHTVWHYLATPALAYTFLPCMEPHAWGPIFAFADLHRVPAAAFELEGRRYEVFGHDWRARPPDAWLAALAGRDPGDEAPPDAHPASAVVVLDEEDFAEAIRQALKGYARPRQLLDSPLLYARLVHERAGPDADEAARVEVLRTLIAEAVAALEETPRDLPFAQALRVTYLRPAPSQTIAAERLDVPFSTFRRHLGRGVSHVTEALWAQEVG